LAEQKQGSKVPSRSTNEKAAGRVTTASIPVPAARKTISWHPPRIEETEEDVEEILRSGNQFSLIHVANACPPLSSSPLSDVRFLPDPAIAIHAALWNHGIILGIPCDYNACLSRRQSPQAGIPSSLLPSPLQLSTTHLTWIDRFPFPRLRDNMILLSDILDQQAFQMDIFITRTLVLAEGRKSWEEGAWRMTKEFAARWGYLFL